MNPVFLAQYYELIDGVPLTYCREHGIDLNHVRSHAGIIAELLLAYDGRGHFDFAGEVPSMVIEVFEAEGSIDLCAWPKARPDSFATYCGEGEALGLSSVLNPATWAFGHYLNVYRTPLQWLQAGCDGCVPLDYRHLPAWLGRVPGSIAVDDYQQAAAIHAALNPRFEKRRILVRSSRQERAA